MHPADEHADDRAGSAPLRPGARDPTGPGSSTLQPRGPGHPGGRHHRLAQPTLTQVTLPGGCNIAGTGKLIARDGSTSAWDSEVPVPWVAVAGGQKHTVRDRTVAGVQMEFYVPPGEGRNLDKLADFAGRSVD